MVTPTPTWAGLCLRGRGRPWRNPFLTAALHPYARLVDDVFLELFDPENPPALGPGPRQGRLSIAQVDAGLARAFVTSSARPESRPLIRALALLWHDHHDAAHALVQDASGGEGAYIHGMLHRREPDFWNAKYWFRRVGSLPFFKPLAEELKRMEGVEALVAGGSFDAARFVDMVEAGAPDEETLKRVQAAEFRVVVDHLAR